MKILLLGGTGAMGTALTDILKDSHQVYVTSRSNRISDSDNIIYFKGNAHDDSFIHKITSENDRWDAIVDFMLYNTSEFEKRVDLLLSSTSQYVLISSTRVYADSQKPIQENFPRLLDVCEDRNYLATDEYALTKARQEDILRSKQTRNWTIIRPSITYSDKRLQLGVLEKENWLYRAIHGRSIVFSKDIGEKQTTMTDGKDVAKGIASLLGQDGAFGEIFHIVQSKSLPWKEVLKIYAETLEERTGIYPKVLTTESSPYLVDGEKKYKIIYGRYFNRIFDNSKIAKYIDVSSFESPEIGLKECLNEFLNKPEWAQNINWRFEALSDKVAREKTPLKEIPSLKQKAVYIGYRYFNASFMNFIFRMTKNKRQRELG